MVNPNIDSKCWRVLEDSFQFEYLTTVEIGLLFDRTADDYYACHLSFEGVKIVLDKSSKLPKMVVRSAYFKWNEIRRDVAQALLSLPKASACVVIVIGCPYLINRGSFSVSAEIYCVGY